MSQITLGGLTVLNTATHLDAMFTELYALRDAVSSTAGSRIQWSYAQRTTGSFSMLGAVTSTTVGTFAGFPGFGMANAAAPSDQKYWVTYADGSTLHFRCDDDNGSFAQDWMQVVRSGWVPSAVYLNAMVAPLTDNARTLGAAGNRWSVVYAGTGSINTSDAEEKQDVQALTTAEQAVAVALKSLVRRFRFKDAVLAKGDGARLHFGVIAQDVAAAFAAQGLDADHYGLFCSDAWTDGDGASRTRLGIRYEELLAFVVAAL